SYDGETCFEISSKLVPANGLLGALTVKGTSMIDALVNDGDIVIMDQSKNFKNGDMVAAWLSDREELTLKRFYLEKNQIRLQPENPTMDPIIYTDLDKVEIQGRVVTVIRRYK
ncbi:MAG: repressor LexA, partial [Chloroflexi bacterium]|nr:repressor LexA [Chloroflexota bacterium]